MFAPEIISSLCGGCQDRIRLRHYGGSGGVGEYTTVKDYAMLKALADAYAYRLAAQQVLAVI